MGNRSAVVRRQEPEMALLDEMPFILSWHRFARAVRQPSKWDQLREVYPTLIRKMPLRRLTDFPVNRLPLSGVAPLTGLLSMQSS